MKICLIIATLEEMYNITMLKTFYEKEKPKENNNNINEKEIINEQKDENIEEIPGKTIHFVPSQSKNELYYHPTYKSNDNLLDNDMDINDITISFNYSPNRAVFQKVNETPYRKLKENYEKRKDIRIKEENEKKEKLLKKRKTKLDEDNFKLDSIFVEAIYFFLCSLISKVEIQMITTNEEDKERVNEKDIGNTIISNKISKEIIRLKNRSVKLTKIVDNKKGDNLIDDLESNDNEDEKIEINHNKISFFIKPHLSFHLSEHTKNCFINNVDRTCTYNKYSSLLNFSDYCIFEMIYNMRYINNSKIKKQLSQLNLYYIQIINFLLILVENIFLIYHYYKGVSSSKEEYDVLESELMNKRFPDVLIIIFVKFGLNGFVIIIWFYCHFIIVYQRNIIFQGEGNFIFRKLDETSQNIHSAIMINFFQHNGSLLDTMDLINKDLSIIKKIKIVLIDTLLANLEINVFIFSIIFDLLFIFFGSPILLSIETILIFGIFPSLLNIFRAFIIKFSNLITCLLFTYCIIYFYNWLAIFNLRPTFDFGEVLEYKSGRYLIEPFCHSSLQCLLVLISYGTRSGGGIADNLPQLSYKNDYNMFIAKFFYDMSFFIIVIMIMGNITFGIIVDSFGGLRDETYNYENDKDNKCFICQITRDGCLLKSIDFDSHVHNIHNIWNYVDFLCYLHLYDPNNFTRVEGFVWDKLIEKDFSWIPLDKDFTGEDEDDN